MTRLLPASALWLAVVHLATAATPCPPPAAPAAPADSHGAHHHDVDASPGDAEEAPRLAGACPCGCAEGDARHSPSRPAWAPPGAVPAPTGTRGCGPLAGALPRLPEAPPQEIDPVPI